MTQQTNQFILEYMKILLKGSTENGTANNGCSDHHFLILQKMKHIPHTINIQDGEE